MTLVILLKLKSSINHSHQIFIKHLLHKVPLVILLPFLFIILQGPSTVNATNHSMVPAIALLSRLTIYICIQSLTVRFILSTLQIQMFTKECSTEDSTKTKNCQKVHFISINLVASPKKSTATKTTKNLSNKTLAAVSLTRS